MAPSRAHATAIATLSLICVATSTACSDDAAPEDGSGGTSGSATGGNAGASAQAGVSGGGSAGASGSAGTAGASAGSSGGGAGGSAGTAGTAGAGNGGAGTAGSGGAGNGGASNGGAGNGGSGNGGMSGAGAGGSAGAGDGGAGAGGIAGGGSGGAAGGGGTGGSGEFTLSSPAFDSLEGCGPGDDAEACDVFPIDNTRFGDDLSPELNWTNPPAGTQSYAIVFQDLTNGFAHWVMWNIPGALTSLPAELPTGAMPSTPAGASQASFRPDEAFTGSGACGNVYEFVLYALSDESISPPQTADQVAVRTFVQGLDGILGQTSIRARSFEPEC